MPKLRLDLDRETFEGLASQALAQRRPVVLQAEVILRQTLGLPFPYPITSDRQTSPPVARDSGG